MNIVKSYKEPNTNVIWFNINDNNFYYFNNGKWRLLNNLEENQEVTYHIQEITYHDLKQLRDNSKLVPGTTYRITDYTCTTSQEGTQSAGHVFDILVTADDVNVLNENAHAIQHSGDTYFANSDLSAWELKYCLDNDINRFAWADDSSAGRGVIYYMKDEWNNECPYDFKNILYNCDFIGFDSNNPYNNYLVSTQSILHRDFLTVKDIRYGKLEAFNNNGDTLLQVSYYNENLGRQCYTFNLTSPLLGLNEFTINEPYNCNNNIIKPYFNSNNKQELNYICFIPHVDTNDIIIINNVFDNNCHGITFVINTNNIFFPSSELQVSENIYGIKNNYFGKECNNDLFMGVIMHNTFGNNFTNNFCFRTLYKNHFGNDIKCNYIGCVKNSTFGDRIEDVLFPYILKNSHFGNDLKSLYLMKSMSNCKINDNISNIDFETNKCYDKEKCKFNIFSKNNSVVYSVTEEEMSYLSEDVTNVELDYYIFIQDGKLSIINPASLPTLGK